MKVALDITPLDNTSPHKVRGSGFYLKHLKDALQQIDTEHEIVYITKGQKIDRGVDIVHYPYFEPFFLTLPSSFPVASVITIHDLTPIKFRQNFPSGFRGSINWHLQKQRLKKASAIITDSFSSKKDIINFTGYNDKKIKVIPLAPGKLFKEVSSEVVSSVKRKYSLPEKFVLYVGDVTWNKNLPRLLNAIKKAELPFILVGKSIADKNFDMNNPWNSDLIKVQQLIESSDKIMSLGFVPDHDLVSIYNAASVFVMPSLYEGFGLPIIEAMSCGTPVITSTEGSLPEVAGDAAIYVDAYDASDISDNILKVFSDSNLQKELSEKGLERSKKFSWSKTAQLTLNVYKEFSQAE